MYSQSEANPFRIDGPVWHEEDFVGRSKEVQRIVKLIQEGQSVSVVGPPGCGKTSLLDHIAQAGVLERHGMRAVEHLFLRLGGRAFAGVDQVTCLCGFYREVYLQFEHADATLKARLAQVQAEMELAGHRGLRTLFRIAQECGFRPVLVLDDFDELAGNDSLDDSFFAALRSLATAGGVVYLVASRRPLYELEKVRPEASTLCGICRQFTLRPFVEEESRGLVLGYLSRTGIEFPPFAVDCILGLGHDQPHSLQLAGYHAFEVWRDNGGQLQEKDCVEVEQRFERAVERAHR